MIWREMSMKNKNPTRPRNQLDVILKPASICTKLLYGPVEHKRAHTQRDELSKNNINRHIHRETNVYLIGFSNLFELGFSFFLVVGVLIRMPLHGKLPVSLLQVFLRNILINLQDLVVVDTHFVVVYCVPLSSSRSHLLFLLPLIPILFLCFLIAIF